MPRLINVSYYVKVAWESHWNVKAVWSVGITLSLTWCELTDRPRWGNTLKYWDVDLLYFSRLHPKKNTGQVQKRRFDRTTGSEGGGGASFFPPPRVKTVSQVSYSEKENSHESPRWTVTDDKLNRSPEFSRDCSRKFSALVVSQTPSCTLEHEVTRRNTPVSFFFLLFFSWVIFCIKALEYACLLSFLPRRYLISYTCATVAVEVSLMATLIVLWLFGSWIVSASPLLEYNRSNEIKLFFFSLSFSFRRKLRTIHNNSISYVYFFCIFFICFHVKKKCQ